MKWWLLRVAKVLKGTGKKKSSGNNVSKRIGGEKNGEKTSSPKKFKNKHIKEIRMKIILYEGVFFNEKEKK